MAYGLSTSAFIESGPTKHVANIADDPLARRSWRELSEVCRLKVVEQALRAANDRIDGYPIAL